MSAKRSFNYGVTWWFLSDTQVTLTATNVLLVDIMDEGGANGVSLLHI